MPVALAGSTKFSDEREQLDVFAVPALESREGSFDRLVNQTTIVAPNGVRPRLRGSRAPAYLRFVASRTFADSEP